MRRNLPPRAALALALALALLVGCEAMNVRRPTQAAPEPIVDRAQVQAMIVSNHLTVLQALMQAGPAQQAEIVSACRRDFEDAPTPSHQLRYALVLATPGHASTDAREARRLLDELLATPETLVPAERTLAQLQLTNVERVLAVTADNQRLQNGATTSERDRTREANRKLAAEVEENARLRRALDEARAKLDAIANIERAITERKSPEGRSP